MIDLFASYRSWKKRTSHITENCEYCGNQRYLLDSPVLTSGTYDYRVTLNACPVCNFDDLQITKQVDIFPLHLFPLIKNGEASLEILK